MQIKMFQREFANKPNDIDFIMFRIVNILTGCAAEV